MMEFAARMEKEKLVKELAEFEALNG